MGELLNPAYKTLNTLTGSDNFPTNIPRTDNHDTNAYKFYTAADNQLDPCLWAAGGRWGLNESLPERNGSKTFQPGRFATFVVALLFGCMAAFYLYKIGWLTSLNAIVPDWLSRYGLWLLVGIFLLRAIGDFRYVSFFKRV